MPARVEPPPAAKRKKQRVLGRHHVKTPSRRAFLGYGAAALTTGGVLAIWEEHRNDAIPEGTEGPPLRPPSASPNDERFIQACVRCGLCGTVCENGCIRYFGLEQTEHGSLTPYLDVRRRSCTLCMRCTQICPSGALSPIPDEPDAILARVRIGRASVDPEHCISYLGRLCGYCHDACPIAEHALRLTPPALPVVLDGCVGCGRCVELCPQTPTAIRVERVS